jgi:hypothetical protein
MDIITKNAKYEVPTVAAIHLVITTVAIHGVISFFAK